MYPTITRAEAEAWRDLHRQLARTRTLQDAKDIAVKAAPPHAKRFYAHLRSFVRTLKSPRRGTRSELYVYRKLRLRFAHGGQPSRVTSSEQRPLPSPAGEDKANIIR